MPLQLLSYSTLALIVLLRLACLEEERALPKAEMVLTLGFQATYAKRFFNAMHRAFILVADELAQLVGDQDT